VSTSLRRALRVLVAIVAIGSVALSGCSLRSVDPRSADIPYPQACALYKLSRQRCDAVVADGRAQAGLDARQVVSVTFIPDPDCGPQPNGETIVCARSGSQVAYLRFALADGGQVEGGVYCGVDSNYRLACTETPEIRVSAPVGSGYSDTPEGATPVPTIDPVAATSARPLEVASFPIPIDRVGHYEVEVGRATLPNGILSETTFGLANTDAIEVTTTPYGVALAVRSTDPTRPPFTNRFERGWHQGAEEVRVLIVFDVAAFRPGAGLEVVDLVVR